MPELLGGKNVLTAQQKVAYYWFDLRRQVSKINQLRRPWARHVPCE